MSARPVRVLHLRDSPWVDGPGRTIVETAVHLDPRRVDYHVGVLSPIEANEHALYDALRERRANVHKIADRRGITRQTVDAITSLVNDLGIDVLHSSEFKSNVLALLAGRRANVKVVCTAHGWIANDIKGRIFRLVDKALLRWFDGVIFVSEAMRRLVPRWWLPDRQVCVLANALVLSKYGADVVDAHRASVDVNTRVAFLNVGRLSPEKGQDLLLHAFADLAKQYPSIKLLFAGIGPMENLLRDLARSLGIADRVEFLGFVRDMPKLYAACDALIQSSLTEGMPNVILEAAYLRVPIIATRVGGTDEVVEHGKSAWLIPPGDLSQLRQAMSRFLETPAEFVAMASVAHANVRAHFSFDARTERLTHFYEMLISNQAR